MNRIVILCVFFGILLAAISTGAQTLEISKRGTSIDVELNNQNNLVLLYEMPQSGTITFNDNRIARTYLNFDLLTNELLFLGENNLLVPIEDQRSIKYVIIGNDVFYYTAKGYIQVIANVNNIQLGIIRAFKIKTLEQTGAYGQSVSSASTQQVSRLKGSSIDVPIFSDLTVKQRATLGYNESYYLVHKNRNIYVKGTRQFSRVFGIDRKILDEFVSKEQLNLKEQANLLKLYNFCSSFQ